MGNYRFVTEFQTGVTAQPLQGIIKPKYFSRPWINIVLTKDYFRLRVPTGYAWDGCSPKWKVGDKWLGTPDFEHTKRGSMCHDALYQYAGQHQVTRKEADFVFFYCMIADSNGVVWKLLTSILYYSAVRAFGGFFWNQRIKNGSK